MERMKQLGVREAAKTMLSGKDCAEQLVGQLVKQGLGGLTDGQQEAFWMGLMASLSGQMAAIVGMRPGIQIVDQCREGLAIAEARRNAEVH